MYLSKSTDYSLKTLIYIAKKNDKFVIVEELQRELNIPIYSLKKVVWSLSKNNILKSIKGKNGGVTLQKDPKDINLGEIIKITESNLWLEEYFHRSGGNLYKISNDKIKYIIMDALTKAINIFSKYTLEDIL